MVTHLLGCKFLAYIAKMTKFLIVELIPNGKQLG